MQRSSQRKQPAPNNMHWSKGNRRSSGSRTARWNLWNVQHFCKVSVTLTKLVYTSSSHTVSQSGWRSQTEQLGGRPECEVKTADRKRWGEFGEKGRTKRRCLDVICWSTWTPLPKRVSGHFLHDRQDAFNNILCRWIEWTYPLEKEKSKTLYYFSVLKFMLKCFVPL